MNGMTMYILTSTLGRNRNILIQGIAYDYLSDPNHILVPASLHQCHHLAQTRDRKSLLLFFQLELLQGVNTARIVTPGAEDYTIRAFLDVIESSIIVY
jgi:hypothetical protein